MTKSRKEGPTQIESTSPSGKKSIPPVSQKSSSNVRPKSTREIQDYSISSPKQGGFFTGLVNKYGKLGLFSIIAGIIGLPMAFFAVTFDSCKTVPSPRNFTVLVPLAATSSEYNAFIENGEYKGKYNNKASQNIRDILEVSFTEWKKNNPNSPFDIEFFCFPEGYADDRTSFEQAFNKALKITKDKKREVVASLGNISSTSTLEYGNFCGRKDQQIPMILPLATATNLTKSLALKKVPAVLRLPPTNDKQSAVISQFLFDNEVYKSVVVKDLSNETYSSDLIEGFRENYVQNPLGKKDSSQKEISFGEILGTIPASGKETPPFLYKELGGKDNGLIVAGMTNSAIEILAQINASGAIYKRIVLTDGAVDEYLGERIMKIQAGSKAEKNIESVPNAEEKTSTEQGFENLYLSFPSPCTMNQSLEKYIENDARLKEKQIDFEMTHSLYVADAAYIILSELKRAISNGSTKEGKFILTSFIEKLKETAKTREKDNVDKGDYKSIAGDKIDLELPFNNIDERRYIIDKNGNNIAANYYLYKMSKKSDGKIKWIPVMLAKSELPPDTGSFSNVGNANGSAINMPRNLGINTNASSPIGNTKKANFNTNSRQPNSRLFPNEIKTKCVDEN